MKEVPLEDRRVFIRADLDVPLSRGRILDPWQLEAALPTIRYCLEHKARVVVASQLGQPKNEQPTPRLSLEPIGAWLAERLGIEVLLTDEPVGDGARRVVQDAREGQLVLLENLRFHPGEMAGEEAFARSLAEGMDLYVGDAFCAVHRRDASTVALPTLVPERAMGLELHANLEIFSRLLHRPDRPFVVVLGGNRIAERLPQIESLLSKVDRILVGGTLAYTFMKCEGREVGASPVEASQLTPTAELMRNARLRGVEILLPQDHRILSQATTEPPVAPLPIVTTADGIPASQKGVDIGPRTETWFAEQIAAAGSVLWIGPLGWWEREESAAGTRALAQAMARAHGFTVVGGASTAAALRATANGGPVRHVTTGGSAALEFLRGRPLPGLAALEN